MNSNSGKMAKQVFATMFETGKSASKILEEEQLQQIDDKGVSGRWLRERSRKIQIKFSNKQCKEKLFGYFVGQVMQETKGRAHTEVLNVLIKRQAESVVVFYSIGKPFRACCV
ncbi:Aspartyl/glutamyl-tRNA(Asn/Gln) amidotransferase subunit B [Anaplasma phagocytophilum]|uniref:Aspartyl/glutamyl-tRNA(Asn/Gln) amidotransferase subunit B n=1 Tax=Anaplasma phagocytophilum TaxID=948 RepID=A0AA45ZHT6_ANAPH|nr:hypothetical protein [Anaplasma phagocytophilum]SBO14609.1 Aspartyl/glutamyl-tRNA(Asn/Gln) amidotransferase subunit B [Anaplasma phagocytophilum]